MGIARSIGDFIVIISSHCIPSNNYWLKNLVNEIKKEKNIAGVYGRQIPMKFSSAQTKEIC